MQIKTRLILIALLIGLALLLTGVVLWFGSSLEAKLQQKDNHIDKLRNDNFEMNMLAQEYLLYGSPRIENQLQVRLTSLRNNLADMVNDCQDNERCSVRMIYDDYRSLDSLLGLLLAEQDNKHQLAGTILVKFQDITMKIRQYDDIQAQELAQLRRNVHLATVALLFLLAGTCVILLWFLSRRLIVGLSQLNSGVKSMAAGALGHRIPESGHDELANLTRAFNQMNVRLQEVINEQKIILNNIGVGVLFLKNRVIFWANPAMTRIFGYAPNELQGQCTEMLYLDRESYLTAGENAYSVFAHEVVHNFQIQMKHKNGKLLWVNLVGQGLSSSDPKEGSIWMLEDITARKQMEAEIIKNRNLESLGILASGIAHDFNNLFQILLGNITLAKMYIPESSEAFDFLTSAESAYQLGTKLTRHLISFASSGFSVRESIQPDEFIKKAVVTQAAGATDLQLEFNLSDDLGLVTVDVEKMEQVMQYLTLNAIEAMPTGGKLQVSATTDNITAAAGIALAAGQYIKISFQDQGHGINKEILPRIFDPYFSTKPLGVKKGMGLGLTLCDTIVKKHGGAITVESTPGAGATFHVYLPAEAP